MSTCTSPKSKIRSRYVKYAKQREDAWGNRVLQILQDCIDLVAAEAIYHTKCAINFQKISTNIITANKKDQQNVTDKEEAFQKFCCWFQTMGENDLHSLNQLYDKMCELSGEKNIFTRK